MAGLPKKYAKMGLAKGWREYKKSKKSPAKKKNKTTTKWRKPTMAKKQYRKRVTKMFSDPTMRGGAISLGGNIAGGALGIDPRLAQLGLSVIGPTKDKAVSGYLLGQILQQGQILTGGGLAGQVGL